MGPKSLDRFEPPHPNPLPFGEREHTEPAAASKNHRQAEHVFLIEHHGKELLASHGVAVPDGAFVPAGGDVSAAKIPDGPVMVKAQVAAGGRGKAGGVASAASRDDAARIVASLDGRTLNGKPIHGFRIEQRVGFAHEAYVSLSIDGEAARIRLLVSAQGGVDVEAQAGDEGGVLTALVETENLASAAAALCAGLPSPIRDALADAVPRLGDIFMRHEATLLEINPLFIMRDGGWMAGDVKLVIDDNAIVRQPAVAALLEKHPGIYPESARKLVNGFDYVEVDPQGEIGLITTGAGLSMQLIDELKAQGRRPLNFCDIRSGQFRGDPARLIAVMQWIVARPSVKVVLVNIFAGITDLAEFAKLLVQAAAAVPELKVPIVARLIGRNLDDARQILAASDLSVTLEPDLDRALTLALATLDGAPRG
jgi:succinyl-CoA synthetase beta subunit